MKLTLSIKEAAVVTAISPAKLRKMMLSGELKGYVSDEKKAMRPSLYSVLTDLLGWPPEPALSFALAMVGKPHDAAGLRREIVAVAEAQATTVPRRGKAQVREPAKPVNDPVLAKHRRFVEELRQKQAPKWKGRKKTNNLTTQ